MIDSHAHLIWDGIEQRLEQIITSAAQYNITEFIHPCVELQDISSMHAISQAYPNKIHIAAGIHPCHSNTWNHNSISEIYEILNSYHIVAIGETGLDYMYLQDISLETQRQAFIEQCEIALDQSLPIIIHCREAFSDIYDILAQYPKLSGIMHCYTGDKAWAKKFIDLGYYISFSGILTYKKADNIREAAQYMPPEYILLETDTPFLAPQSQRGKTNEPAFMHETALYLADLRNISIEEIDLITTANTRRAFPKIIYSD